jgi:hypothetical protein
MRLLPDRWTIDFWPMRTIVSVYLIVTGALIGGAVVMTGFMIQAAAALASAAALRVFGALFLVRTGTAQPGPAHVSLGPYLAGGGAVGAFFLVATALMWTRMRGNWVAAAAAALVGAGAWWLLAYAVLAQSHRGSPAAAIVFNVMTAVVTLGVLVATLQRAPEEA